MESVNKGLLFTLLSRGCCSDMPDRDLYRPILIQSLLHLLFFSIFLQNGAATGRNNDVFQKQIKNGFDGTDGVCKLEFVLWLSYVLQRFRDPAFI